VYYVCVAEPDETEKGNYYAPTPPARESDVPLCVINSVQLAGGFLFWRREMKVSLEWFASLVDELDYMHTFQEIDEEKLAQLRSECYEMLRMELRRIDSEESA
jgi:hypothetical protein